jgi:hypothetical protein
VPRGGRRVGAGRKPKTGRQHFLSGDAGKRNLALVPKREETAIDGAAVPVVAAVDVPTIGAAGEVPAMLTPEEVPYWNLWAPLALENNTLDGQTRPGFVLLCQVASRAAQLWGAVVARGVEVEHYTMTPDGQERLTMKANPLLTHYRGLMARQEQLQARYGLASSGAKKDSGKPKEDDELDELRKLMAIR